MKKIKTAILILLTFVFIQETNFWYFNASTEYKRILNSTTTLQENIFYGDSLFVSFDWGIKKVNHGSIPASNRHIKVEITDFNKYYFASWFPFGFRYIPVKMKALVIEESRNDTLGSYKYYADFKQLGFCSRKNMVRRIEKQFARDVLSDFEIRKRGRHIQMNHITLNEQMRNCFSCEQVASFNLGYFTFEEKPGYSRYCIRKQDRIDTFTLVPPNNIFNDDSLNQEIVAFDFSENRYVVERYYSSGQLAVRANYIHDNSIRYINRKTYKTGIYSTWHPNGQVQNEMFSPDEEFTDMREYYPNGNLKNKYKYWHRSGQSGPIDTLIRYNEFGEIIEFKVY